MNINNYPYLKGLMEKNAVSIRIPGVGTRGALDVLKHMGSAPFTTALERGAEGAVATGGKVLSKAEAAAERAARQKSLLEAANDTFAQMGGQWQPTNPGYGLSL